MGFDLIYAGSIVFWGLAALLSVAPSGGVCMDSIVFGLVAFAFTTLGASVVKTSLIKKDKTELRWWGLLAAVGILLIAVGGYIALVSVRNAFLGC